jgi:hypothetical protein
LQIFFIIAEVNAFNFYKLSYLNYLIIKVIARYKGHNAAKAPDNNANSLLAKPYIYISVGSPVARSTVTYFRGMLIALVGGSFIVEEGRAASWC